MKKIILSTLAIMFCIATMVAQQEEKSPKKMVIKKRTVENINGVETVTETTDTIETLNFDEFKHDHMDWEDEKDVKTDVRILKDGDDQKVIIKRFKKEGEDGKEMEIELDGDHDAYWFSKEENEKILPPNKAVLGVQLSNVEGENGAQVLEVFEGSAAEKAGLQEGDILLSVRGKETKNVEAVINALSENNVGDKVKISYLRGTKVKSTKAILQERNEIPAMDMDKVKMMKRMKCCKGSEIKCEDMKKMIIRMKDGDKMIEHMKMMPGEGGKKMIFIHKDEDGKTKEIEIKGEGEDQMIWMEKEGAEKNESESLNVEVLTGSPNPNDGRMKISYQGQEGPIMIEVLDLNGKEVFREKLDQFDGNYEKEINIDNIKGTMILKISQGDKIKTQKIIVK